MEVYNIIQYLSIFSILPPLIYSLVLLWQRQAGRLTWQIFGFSVFIAVVEAAGWISSYKGLNNLWMSHVYIPLEYAILAYMYLCIFNNKIIKRLIIGSVVLFFLFCALDIVYLESLTIYNSYPRVIESVLMVLLSLLYFYKVFKDIDKADLLTDPYFLLSVGVIVNFAGSSVINSLFNVMLQYPAEIMLMCLAVLNFLNVLFNTTLVLVLRRAPRV
ncbi:hypothetical protein FVR03_06925 [Pontibacter qinzhouensis]|uniref:Histidine kinase N-terminal 7TM region domain-containing protein n=1 Tax=Pontibacter qinzhouensis TaxID=2603253 RepID=A0A5C8KAV3_9BACT|nr:hypothetical protein [Pontibacter qinzhouensis]TXK49110.1 hypothetical protein FVR03_06925 [Pontibacter qinzhouensis]